ncbi:MAG: hypothetical protein U5L96_15445 [Owenweeksia sp.]|nr:hypothetical protein [Owenweeksia sp.]
MTVGTLLVASGCRKKRQESLPDVPSSDTSDLNNPSNNSLQHPGGWVYYSGGYDGLIVYRRDLQNRAR